MPELRKNLPNRLKTVEFADRQRRGIFLQHAVASLPPRRLPPGGLPIGRQSTGRRERQALADGTSLPSREIAHQEAIENVGLARSDR